MTLTAVVLEALSEKFSRQFAFRMPSASHLLPDLKQEAAIAILKHAPRWREGAGANLETFTRIYAWRAMQELCTTQSGPVAKPMVNGKFEGTFYGAQPSSDGRRLCVDYDTMAITETHTPESHLVRKQAEDLVRDFVQRRSERFTGKGKLSREAIQNALRDMLAGDSCIEVGRRYGCSKQYMSMLAAQAGIS